MSATPLEHAELDDASVRLEALVEHAVLPSWAVIPQPRAGAPRQAVRDRIPSVTSRSVAALAMKRVTAATI